MTATQAAPPRVQGLVTVPVGGGGAWPDHETTRQAKPQQPGPTGVEGAGRICRGAGGRWRGLAGSRDNAPSQTSATRPHWGGGRRRDLPRCRWAAAGPGRASRRRAERSSRRGRLAARTARGRAADHRHTQRPGPPAPGTPVGPHSSPTQRPGPPAPRTPAAQHAT